MVAEGLSDSSGLASPKTDTQTPNGRPKTVSEGLAPVARRRSHGLSWLGSENVEWLRYEFSWPIFFPKSLKSLGSRLFSSLQTRLGICDLGFAHRQSIGDEAYAQVLVVNIFPKLLNQSVLSILLLRRTERPVIELQRPNVGCCSLRLLGSIGRNNSWPLETTGNPCGSSKRNSIYIALFVWNDIGGIMLALKPEWYIYIYIWHRWVEETVARWRYCHQLLAEEAPVAGGALRLWTALGSPRNGSRRWVGCRCARVACIVAVGFWVQWKFWTKIFLSL